MDFFVRQSGGYMLYTVPSPHYALEEEEAAHST